MRTRNTLNSKQLMRLAIELNAYWTPFVEKKRPTYAEAAKYFSQLLGFTVSSANLEGVVNRLEKIWPGAQPPQLANAANVTRKLAALVIRIADSQGESVDPALRAYIGSSNGKDDGETIG